MTTQLPTKLGIGNELLFHEGEIFVIRIADGETENSTADDISKPQNSKSTTMIITSAMVCLLALLSSRRVCTASSRACCWPLASLVRSSISSASWLISAERLSTCAPKTNCANWFSWNFVMSDILFSFCLWNFNSTQTFCPRGWCFPRRWTARPPCWSCSWPARRCNSLGSHWPRKPKADGVLILCGAAINVGWEGGGMNDTQGVAGAVNNSEHKNPKKTSAKNISSMGTPENNALWSRNYSTSSFAIYFRLAKMHTKKRSVHDNKQSREKPTKPNTKTKATNKNHKNVLSLAASSAACFCNFSTKLRHSLTTCDKTKNNEHHAETTPNLKCWHRLSINSLLKI